MLPLFNGSRVKLRLIPSGSEYEVSVNLIRGKSPYFAKMFQDCFIEGIEGEATLEEIDGVVSPRSLENLLQWIYREKIIFTSRTPQDQISEGLEFLRMADMCDTHGMEQVLADYMQNVVKDVVLRERTNVILPQHIASTSLLPRNHPFRSVVAKALVLPLIENEEFSLSLSDYPSICADILKEVRTICHAADATVDKGKWSRDVFIIYEDPFKLSYQKVRLHTRRM